jgi:hypothetical protein
MLLLLVVSISNDDMNESPLSCFAEITLSLEAKLIEDRNKIRSNNMSLMNDIFFEK